MADLSVVGLRRGGIICGINLRQGYRLRIQTSAGEEAGEEAGR